MSETPAGMMGTPSPVKSRQRPIFKATLFIQTPPSDDSTLAPFDMDLPIAEFADPVGIHRRTFLANIRQGVRIGLDEFHSHIVISRDSPLIDIRPRYLSESVKLISLQLLKSEVIGLRRPTDGINPLANSVPKAKARQNRRAFGQIFTRRSTFISIITAIVRERKAAYSVHFRSDSYHLCKT